MRSAKSGPNLYQIWQAFGPWASPFGANGQMTMTVHNYRPRQFYRTSNGENPSSGYRDMGSASLAAARPAARPPARTVTTIPLQPGGLRGKNEICVFSLWSMFLMASLCLVKYLTLRNKFNKKLCIHTNFIRECSWKCCQQNSAILIRRLQCTVSVNGLPFRCRDVINVFSLTMSIPKLTI